MTQIEIKNKIDVNNRRIEEIFNPSVFELNPEIAELLQENNELRKHCLH